MIADGINPPTRVSCAGPVAPAMGSNISCAATPQRDRLAQKILSAVGDVQGDEKLGFIGDLVTVEVHHNYSGTLPGEVRVHVSANYSGFFFPYTSFPVNVVTTVPYL